MISFLIFEYYDIVCDIMSTIKNKRISICLSIDEFDKWRYYNTRENLSAFVRMAVNDFISKQKSKLKEDFDLHSKIDQNLYNIQKIEEDLLEIQVALAKNDIIPDIESESRMKRFLELQMARTELSAEDRKMYFQIRKKLNK